MKIMNQADDVVIGIYLVKDNDVTVKSIPTKHGYVVICSDYDDECVDVKDKARCWFYNPSDGVCPFMRKEL